MASLAYEPNRRSFRRCGGILCEKRCERRRSNITLLAAEVLLLPLLLLPLPCSTGRARSSSRSRRCTGVVSPVAHMDRVTGGEYLRPASRDRVLAQDVYARPALVVHTV